MKKTKLIYPIIVGSLLRILWVVWRGIPFTSDSAVFGLMAKHIMRGKEYPIFFYGQSYLGALTSYILSFIMRFTDNLMLPFYIYGVVCSVFLSILLVLLAKDVLGDRTAWWVSLLMIAPPYYFVIWLMGVYGYYTYIFVGIIYVWSISKWVKDDFKLNLKWLIVNGLIAGIGWFSHPMFCYFIALFGLFAVISFFKSNKIFIEFAKKLFLWTLFFFIGSFFYWIGFFKNINEYNPIASFKLNIFIFMKGFIYALWRKIPVLLSIDKGLLPFQAVMLCVYIVLLCFIVNFIYTTLKERKISIEHVFVILGVLMVFIYSFEQPYYSFENTRHLVPLIIVWPVLITFMMEKYFKRKNYLKYLLVFVILTHNVISAFAYDAQNKNLSKLISYLENKNLKTGFADYWSSYCIDYFSDEKIIVAPLYDVDRYSEYSVHAVASDNKFYLFDLDNEKQNKKYLKFLGCLKKARLIYQEDTIENYHIFHSLFDETGCRIDYITPLFEEYFNKDELAKNKCWINAFFLGGIPYGSYTLKIGVSGEFDNNLPENKKILTLVGNKLENHVPFAMIQIQNDEFKEKHFIERQVVFYFASNGKLCFGTYFFDKTVTVEYIILKDHVPPIK